LKNLSAEKMKQKKYMPDTIDKKIVAELHKNGRTSYKVIAQKLNLSDGTIRLRIAKMIENNFLKISASVNPFFYKNSIAAMIGMKLETRNHTKIMQKISRLKGVTSVVNLTGSFDILVEVFFHSREELRLFLIDDINEVGGILSSETFILLDAINKWVEFF
jgi:Lrp/AsnC family transcriptional regulator for asnA, asnC and gidA